MECVTLLSLNRGRTESRWWRNEKKSRVSWSSIYKVDEISSSVKLAATLSPEMNEGEADGGGMGKKVVAHGALFIKGTRFPHRWRPCGHVISIQWMNKDDGRGSMVDKRGTKQDGSKAHT